MKFICEKGKLLLALNSVSRTSVGRTTTPILEGIYISVKRNNVLFITNDLDIGMEYTLEDVETIEDGATVVDCRMFSEIIRKLPDEKISLEVNDKNLLVIECEGSVYKLSTMNHFEFPMLPNIDVEKSISVSQGALKEMIKKTIFAVSAEENRPIFTGCLIEVADDELKVVAVDGFRLALRKLPMGPNVGSFSAIVPGKYLNEIVKNLQDIDDVLTISVSKNQALFEIQNCRIVSRLLEGDFLNYNSVIPVEKETRIKVNKSALQSAIERAAIFSMSAAEKEKKYPIKIFVSLGSIIISCTSQVGDAKEEVLVETTGKELEIGFNHKYLIDALKVIEDDEVYLDFGSAISPCVIRPLVDNKYTYMVLPVRLKE